MPLRHAEKEMQAPLLGLAINLYIGYNCSEVYMLYVSLLYINIFTDFCQSQNSLNVGKSYEL